MVHLRLMREGDAEAAYRVASSAFAENDAEVLNRSEEEVERRMARYGNFLKYDPDGCFVAEEDGRVVGVAIAVRREGLWVLSLFVVEKGSRGSGLGGELMTAALAYGEGCDAGMVASSTHPAAMRSYANAGFVLYPTFTAKGKVRRENVPDTPNVREGGAEDLALAAEVDRQLRGAAHGPDLEFMLGAGKMLVSDGEHGRGYAVLQDGGLWLLGATNEETASELLWASLAAHGSEEEVEVRWITAPQAWAVQVVLAAGLDLHPDGPICIRGNPGPLKPYLPSGPYL